MPVTISATASQRPLFSGATSTTPASQAYPLRFGADNNNATRLAESSRLHRSRQEALDIFEQTQGQMEAGVLPPASIEMTDYRTNRSIQQPHTAVPTPQTHTGETPEDGCGPKISTAIYAGSTVAFTTLGTALLYNASQLFKAYHNTSTQKDLLLSVMSLVGGLATLSGGVSTGLGLFETLRGQRQPQEQ
ncbi:hypothetical protein [Vampirovibrio sp.]|uniref:hypothetical protein n=1 Tax=Vampirovibrio sp. TaxID=2717857 RepID=UPI003593E314